MSYKYSNVHKTGEITFSAEIEQILKSVLVEDTYQFISQVNDTLIAKFMGPIWGRKDPGGPHVDPMNLAIWELMTVDFPAAAPP